MKWAIDYLITGLTLMIVWFGSYAYLAHRGAANVNFTPDTGSVGIDYIPAYTSAFADNSSVLDQGLRILYGPIHCIDKRVRHRLWCEENAGDEVEAVARRWDMIGFRDDAPR